MMAIGKAACVKCGHVPEPVKQSARDARHAFYKALQAIGAQLCPICKDYVMLATHQCGAYQALRAHVYECPIREDAA
jgi:ribosomal protein L32